MLVLEREARVVPLTFRDVYEQNAAFVWRVLRRLGVRDADVEDVCQDVFVIVHRKLATFEHRSAVQTWIYGIALRCASDYRRRAHIKRETPAEIDETQIDPNQDDVVSQRQGRAMLDQIVDSLDDDKRAVFVLYELEEVPMAQVAEIVGCPLQTAYSRLHAARTTVEAIVARLRAREPSQ
ncbi:MAG: RNA polymerase sigma factor [Kofleriaceae bacterium]